MGITLLKGYVKELYHARIRIIRKYAKTIILTGALASLVFTSASKQESISDFIKWAEGYNIRLVGVNKTTNDFYYNGAKEGDFFDIDNFPDTNIPRILNAAEGLYKIPEDLLKVMNSKTFYLSNRHGRGYVVLGSWPEQNILAGMNRGAIIEQPITEEDAVHEFAHILDYHGIRGIYDDPEAHWKHLEPIRREIFNVPMEYNSDLSKPPEGYISVYSTANDAENFAEHFTAYILNSEEFHDLAKNDLLLKQKYDFFKNYLFDGREY